jgi:uncharacterized protein YcnI
MSPLRKWCLRVLTTGAIFFIGSIAASPPAWAHVHASTDNAVRGAVATVTFQVPNESNSGAATTSLSVALPNVATARSEAMPGWTARLDRDAAAGVVRSVTWTAAPGGGIGPDQFALFRISVQLPDTDTATFPATQTYSDGVVVNWDQPPLPGGGEPEHPAPTLTLAAGGAPHDHHPASGAPSNSPQHHDVQSEQQKPPSDNTARLLAGAALITGGVGIALALIRRRT